MNTYNNFEERLRALRQIQPDKAFVGYAKARILATHQERFAAPVVWGGALATVVFVAVVAVTLLTPALPVVRALDQQALHGELEGLGLDLQIEQVEYNQKVHDTITAALREIEGETNHLNTELLESEDAFVDVEGLQETPSAEVDKLLEKLLQ